MLRKTVTSFLDDADVSTRKISDQLGHSKINMTHDRYLGRKLTDPQIADVLENCWVRRPVRRKCPKSVCDLNGRSAGTLGTGVCAPPGTRTPNPLIKR